MYVARIGLGRLGLCELPTGWAEDFLCQSGGSVQGYLGLTKAPDHFNKTSGIISGWIQN
jgi:hypothetical protein